jgi:hypothetical protein
MHPRGSTVVVVVVVTTGELVIGQNQWLMSLGKFSEIKVKGPVGMVPKIDGNGCIPINAHDGIQIIMQKFHVNPFHS